MGVVQDIKAKLQAAEAELAALTSQQAPTTAVASDVNAQPSLAETLTEAANIGRAKEALVEHGVAAQNS